MIKIDRHDRARRYDNRKEFMSKPRVYIWPEGESILENFGNRHARPYKEYRKRLMPTVLAYLGLPADTKFSWSKHAGCTMCPCSPGFILELPREGYREELNFGRFDVHVTADEFPATTDEGLALARQAQLCRALTKEINHD